MNPITTISLELDPRDADLLGTCQAKAFVREQPCRFEPHGDGDHLSSSWEGGKMTWCASAAEALMIRAYEKANGFKAMILWDVAAGFDKPLEAWVVLSNRPWA